MHGQLSGQELLKVFRSPMLNVLSNKREKRVPTTNQPTFKLFICNHIFLIQVVNDCLYPSHKYSAAKLSNNLYGNGFKAQKNLFFKALCSFSYFKLYSSFSSCFYTSSFLLFAYISGPSSFASTIRSPHKQILTSK